MTELVLVWCLGCHASLLFINGSDSREECHCAALLTASSNDFFFQRAGDPAPPDCSSQVRKSPGFFSYVNVAVRARLVQSHLSNDSMVGAAVDAPTMPSIGLEKRCNAGG